MRATSHGVRQLFCASIISVLCFGVIRTRAAEDVPTREQIIKAWKQRENVVKSARFSWNAKRFETKGWKKSPSMYKSVNPEGLTIPPADVTYDIAQTFCFDRERYRYTLWNKTLQPDTSKYGLPTEILAFDGSINRAFFSPVHEGGEPDNPEGHIKKMTAASVKGNGFARPFMFTFRMTDIDWINFGWRNFVLTPKRGVVDGASCLVLEGAEAKIGKTSVWIDPQRGFIVLRAAYQNKQGKTTVQYDIAYKEDKPTSLWVPAKWSYVLLDHVNASPQFSTRAELVEYAINPQIDAGEFTFEFPVGTYVMQPDEWGPSYIQREDGAKRPIERNEWGFDYEQYLNTEPGEAALQNKTSPANRLLILSLIGITGALAICYVIWRGWRRKPRVLE